MGSLIFYGIAAFFIYTLYSVFFGRPAPGHAGSGRGGGYPGGGGPGGPGGGPGGPGSGPGSPPSDEKHRTAPSEAPPPYSPYSSTTSSYGSYTQTQAGGSSWGTAGTFLAGTMAGGLLSSMWNRNREPASVRQAGTRTQFEHRSTTAGTSSSSSSNWGASSSSSSGGGSSFTGQTHTSSGYGGTRRR